MVDDVMWGEVFEPKSDQQFLDLRVDLIVWGLKQQGVETVHVLLEVEYRV